MSKRTLDSRAKKALTKAERMWTDTSISQDAANILKKDAERVVKAKKVFENEIRALETLIYIIED